MRGNRPFFVGDEVMLAHAMGRWIILALVKSWAMVSQVPAEPDPDDWSMPVVKVRVTDLVHFPAEPVARATAGGIYHSPTRAELSGMTLTPQVYIGLTGGRLLNLRTREIVDYTPSWHIEGDLRDLLPASL